MFYSLWELRLQWNQTVSKHKHVKMEEADNKKLLQAKLYHHAHMMSKFCPSRVIKTCISTISIRVVLLWCGRLQLSYCRKKRMSLFKYMLNKFKAFFFFFASCCSCFLPALKYCRCKRFYLCRYLFSAHVLWKQVKRHWEDCIPPPAVWNCWRKEKKKIPLLSVFSGTITFGVTSMFESNPGVSQHNHLLLWLRPTHTDTHTLRPCLKIDLDPESGSKPIPTKMP